MLINKQNVFTFKFKSITLLYKLLYKKSSNIFYLFCKHLFDLILIILRRNYEGSQPASKLNADLIIYVYLE